MNRYDLIIIGSGPAGMTAAIYGARANLAVLMLDRLAPGGQIINTEQIQNYPGIEAINGAELAIQMFQHTQSLKVAFDYKTVKEISKEGDLKAVRCEEENQSFVAPAVLIATGSRPRMLGAAKEAQFAGRGISWCAICDGAQYQNQDVVVIGGGNSAVEESIYLAGIVKSLTVVTMFDLTADPIACKKLRSFTNVTIYSYQEILGFYGENKLEGIHFKSAKTGKERRVSCQGVFEYIGMMPNTSCFKSLEILDGAGYIRVNENMETEVPGIYGAGDCTAKRIRQVVTACSDGAIAALAASHYVESI